jgi:hypothetical protein
VSVLYAWLPEDALNARGPAEDYSSQPADVTTPAPADPGVPSVDTSLRSGLSSSDLTRATAKYDFELGAPGVCDPVEAFVCNPPEPRSERERQRRCEPSARGNRDPDPSRTTSINAPALYVRHRSFSRRLPSGGTAIVALRKGWTAQHAVREWSGFGWRHVFAKHGWATKDINATTTALQAVPVRSSNGLLVYTGPRYQRNGELCVRKVVVADAASADEPAEKGIITSYGSLAGP